jgi:hypothetical protein
MEPKKTEKERSVCPYCEEEIIQAAFPYCQACPSCLIARRYGLWQILTQQNRLIKC